MRNLLAAVGAVLRAIGNAMRTVSAYCWRTGKWMTKTVVTAPVVAVDALASMVGIGGGRGGPTNTGAKPATTAEATAERPSAKVAGMDRVRKLAVGLAAGHVPASLFESMPDPIVEWLTAMDRKMLCRVGCATDAQLASHLRGEESMRGVLVYDKSAIAEYRAAQGLDLDEDPDIEMHPAPAMAA